jgi:hypothetical protein
MPRPSQHLYRPVQKAGVRFFIRFSTVFDTLYYGFEMVIFQKQRFFFCGNNILVLPVAIQKYLFRIFFIIFFAV